MAGTVKNMLDTIITQRAKGNPTFAESTRCKLILKGVNPAKFSAATPDDPAVIAKVRTIAAEFGIQL